MEHSDLYYEKLEWNWKCLWAMEQGYCSVPDEPEGDEEEDEYEDEYEVQHA